MKKYLFFGFWVVIGILLLILSLISKNEKNAMIARVESRVVALSFQYPVKVRAMHVVPGQRVQKGDLLFEVSSPAIDLDIEQRENELAGLDLEISSVEDELDRKIQLKQTEYEIELAEERSDLRILKAEASARKSSREAVSGITGVAPRNDSVTLIKIRDLELGISALLDQKSKELSALESEKNNRLAILHSQKEIVEKEALALNVMKESLTNRAANEGTVGNVFVENNELVSPYKKLLTLYEIKPTLIKAYVNEGQASILRIGDRVLIRASNREISTEGEIEEIGTRVTDYPIQINPGAEARYGQEVFIRIPQAHEFLDGEMVLVFPMDSK